MIVPAKSIPLHSSRFGKLLPDEEFDIPSGLGGSFTISFDGYRGEKTIADYIIISGSPPPDGWRGMHRSMPVEKFHASLSAHPAPPESPYYDDGKRELTALRQMGHPEDSPEIQSLLRRFPKNA